jgi:ATP-dependent Zn protease
MPKDLNEANPIQMFMLPPVETAEAGLTSVREKYYYELKLLIEGRVVGTTMFEFRYQLADSEYVNTIYVNNTSYTSSIPKESPTFLDYLFIGFTIAVLISAATYLIMNASEKSIFTEDENEEE